MTHPGELLPLRLTALEQDINTVRAAVRRAKLRGQFIEKATKRIRECTPQLRGLRATLNALNDAMTEEPRIGELIGETSFKLDEYLRDLPDLTKELVGAVQDVADNLGRAAATTVSIDDRSKALEASLERRCDELSNELKELRTKVDTESHEKRREHWKTYEVLLVKARPVFCEYVDFLGGLTVRDTGLDDRVCEMTDALLNRFVGTTPQKSLPLPARQAGLGYALDSVVLLGFPEWSIWGIPLVGHEIGLAYANDQNDPRLVELIRTYVAKGAHNEEYVRQLVADAFAAYTLGFCYACAALLLRLSPRHDQEHRYDEPPDIDRARVIMFTLRAGGDTAPESGGTYSDDVERLGEMWEAAVRERAGKAMADEAAAQAAGPPPHQDWLDDFVREAIEVFRGLRLIRPFDDDRWAGAMGWYEALRDEEAGPSWHPVDDTVPDVLTAAWRRRLFDGASPEELATKVMERWTTDRKGVSR